MTQLNFDQMSVYEEVEIKGIERKNESLQGCIPFLKIRSASILLAYNTR